MNSPTVENAVLTLIAEDLAADRLRPISDYLGRFPGFEAVVAATWYRNVMPFDAPIDDVAALDFVESGESYAEIDALFEDRPLPPTVGDRVRGYRLVERIGHGGQASVFLAHDASLDRQVALKLATALGPNDGAARARFEREARLLAALEHPSLPTIYEVGSHAGTPFIAMQLIAGETLDRRARRWREEDGRARCDRGARLVRDIARAIALVHEHGVCHRDLKPSNVIVTDDGTPVVIDFGLAGLRGDDAITRGGDLFGTPAYMAPEQLTRQGIAADERTDVWALAVILYELVTGQRPFDGPTREATFSGILASDPARPREIERTVPRDLEAIVLRGLEKPRETRYASAGDLADDLDRFLRGEVVQANRGRRLSIATVTPWLRRRGPLLTLGLAAVVAVIAWIGDREAERQVRMLGDLELVDRLLVEADELWPRRTDRVPAMRAWLAAATDVRSRETAYRRLRRELDASPASSGASRSQRAVLDHLRGGYERLATCMAGVRERLATAETIDEATLVGAREAWGACLADLRAGDSAAKRLTPQSGLVPLGRDRDSGLWEFFVFGTGTQPAWEGATLDGKLRLGDDDGIVLVLIPGGAMRGRNDDDRRPITVKPFFIGKTEITQRQYESLMGANPSLLRAGTKEGDAAISPRHPVESIGWRDADEAARRLDLTLPTEAQWSFACWGGTMKRWSGLEREALPRYANLADAEGARVMPNRRTDSDLDDGFGYHAPVGSLLPNDFGLHDMMGNVREWVTEPLPPWRQAEHRRVMKGGGFSSMPEEAAALTRENWPEDETRASCGFRVARPLALGASHDRHP